MQSWRLQLQTAGNEKPGIAQCSLRFVVGAALLLATIIGVLMPQVDGGPTGILAFAWVIPAALFLGWQLVDRENLSLQDRLSGTRLHHYPKKPADKTDR